MNTSNFVNLTRRKTLRCRTTGCRFMAEGNELEGTGWQAQPEGHQGRFREGASDGVGIAVALELGENQGCH